MENRYAEQQEKLVRGLAHKLNNILSLFHGYLGLVMEDPRLDPGLMRNMLRLKEAAQSATDLVERTKVLVRPALLAWSDVDPREFLALIEPSLEPCLERGINIQTECPEGLPSLHIDPARLRTVLVELVKNAVEASADGATVTLAVRLEDMRSGEGTDPVFLLEVIDTGCGISSQMADKVLDPFVSTRTPRGALGLGLPLALGLLDQMHGSLQFASQPGRTVFTVRLPGRPGGVRLEARG